MGQDSLARSQAGSVFLFPLFHVKLREPLQSISTKQRGGWKSIACCHPHVLVRRLASCPAVSRSPLIGERSSTQGPHHIM